MNQVEQARQAARQVTAAQEALEAATDALESLLGPAVRAWDSVEPVPCGHTGGWSLDTREDHDGPVDAQGKVHLIHRCFYAHNYDLNDRYTTEVDLDRLLGVSA